MQADLIEEEIAGPDDGEQPAHWQKITENIYLNERKSNKNGKHDQMQCDCEMEYEDGEPQDGCGEDCINRLLMIECSPKLCPCGEFCHNQRFQRRQYAGVEIFKAGQKGFGLRAKEYIPEGTFIREYVGEVCSNHQFQERSAQYHLLGRRHHYFMTLRTDEIIDATMKGNISRFINHSCEPNCETQKWTVNGRLRVGFFSVAPISKGVELTFDYQFQRSGEGAQPCYCGAESCRGIIGGKQDRLEKTSDKSARLSSKKVRVVPEDDELTLEIKSLRRGSSLGIHDPNKILPLSRVMVMAEHTDHRLLVLETLLATHDDKCLRMFMKLQGLSLLWSWMVDCEDETTEKLASGILDVLSHLPVPNLNPLLDSKVLSQVKRWSSAPVCQRVRSSALPTSEDSGLPGTPVKTFGEPSNIGAPPVVASDSAARHAVIDEEHLCKSPSSSPDVKRTPSNGDSGVESPGGSGNGVDSICENSVSAAPSEQAQATVQIAAQQLLEKWSDLKEVYRIPKKAPSSSSKSETPKPPRAPPRHPSPPVPPARSRPDRKHSKWDSFSRPHRRDKDRSMPPRPSSRRWDSPYNNSRRADPATLPFLSKPPCPIVEAVVNSAQKTSSNTSSGVEPAQSRTPDPGSPAPPVCEGSPSATFTSYSYQLPVTPNPQSMLAMQSYFYQQQVATASAASHAPEQGTVTCQTLPAASNLVNDPGTPLSSRGEEEDMECSSDEFADAEASPKNLPTDWLYARDEEGRLYYYHVINREPQWDRPDGEFQPPLPEGSDGEDEPAPPPEESCQNHNSSKQQNSTAAKQKSSSDTPAKASGIKRRHSTGSSDQPAKKAEKSTSVAEQMVSGVRYGLGCAH